MVRQQGQEDEEEDEDEQGKEQEHEDKEDDEESSTITTMIMTVLGLHQGRMLHYGLLGAPQARTTVMWSPRARRRCRNSSA